VGMHRLTQITIGVPDVDAVTGFYREFGLAETESGMLATRDGGAQLRLVHAPQRRLVELGIGVESPDDLDRIHRSLRALGTDATNSDGTLHTVEPVTATRVVVTVAPAIEQASGPLPLLNRPGDIERTNQRAEGLERAQQSAGAPVQPRKLGHVVLGSPDQEATQRFFTDGLGFKVSDSIPGIAAFLRCSTDHHNLLVQGAPVTYLHHTSWQVDDVDDVGRAATAMLDADPKRQVWGLGRHYLGSNFFWYLRDPAGNFAEYYSDLDVIDDEWHPTAIADRRALYAWGPPVPDEFLLPVDLASLS
jgi:catechol 2,3-dioxygenase-like lactoylglutathione lyase family enzyme